VHDETLRAAVTRIIPADDFPDAWEAGVGVYIQRLLAGDARHLAPWFAAGLDALDAEARAGDGCAFAALPAEGQDHLFDRVARGDVQATWPVAPQEFMATLIRLVHEGYYADPANGGNRHAASWAMLGFDPRLPYGEQP
jgi:gluconate 2-dehydrogenase gamma chain